LDFRLPTDRMLLTPSAVAADYLSGRRFKRVMVLGGAEVSAPLEGAGIQVVRPAKKSDRAETHQVAGAVDAIFVGWYREFSMDDLEAACQAVWTGARLFTSSLAPPRSWRS
jgi:ribonucleotide monophosphatase NagD (HAD superfamily)